MGQHYSYKDIQLPQLRGFCLAATSRSFTAAAKALGLSVPAVWQQVRALERELGATLLRREGAKVAVTDEGRLLLELVQPHVSGLDSLARLFESRKAELPQKLTVVSNHAFMAYHLPAVVQEFSRRHPGILLRLRADIRPAELSQMLEQGEADLGVFPYDPGEPRSKYLQYDDLYEMRLFLLTAKDHPLVRKKKFALADVVQYPMVLEPEGSLTRKVMERLLGRQELANDIHIVTESTTLDIIRRYVALGVGISFMYMDDAVGRLVPELHRRLLEPVETVPVAVVVRKGAHLPQPVEEFVRLLHEHCR